MGSLIAFALLAWIGGNMIRGGGDDPGRESCSVDPTKGRKLLISRWRPSTPWPWAFLALNINVWGRPP
ncbi:MAG: hypothetical protein ACLRWP_17080 [Bilophila wadsworthia]